MNHTPESTTHYACDKAIAERGGKTPCCACTKHECSDEKQTFLIDTNVYDTPEKMALLDIKLGYGHANYKHSKFKNTHEFYGVLMEEVYEVLQAIHANDDNATYSEIKDVAATCCKAMVMLREQQEKKDVL